MDGKADRLLEKLGELANSQYDDIQKYLTSVAEVIAEALCPCEKDQQHFSILEIVSLSGSGGRGVRDGYRILDEDLPKINTFDPDDGLALTMAKDGKNVVIVNDVEPGTLAFYLGTHVERENPKHLAILPCKYGVQVKYLLVFDRIECERRFSEEERVFLTQASRIIPTGIIRYVRSNVSHSK